MLYRKEKKQYIIQHYTMKHFQGTNKLAIVKVKIILNQFPFPTKYAQTVRR